MTSKLARKEQIINRLEAYDNALIFKKIEELGLRNVSSLMQIMTFDDSKDYHHVSNCFSATAPLKNQEIAPLGPAAHTNFNIIQPAWHQHSDMLSFLAGEISRGGLNFTIVTNHSNVIDIALVLGALRLEIEIFLKSYGLDEIDFSNSSGIIISRGITATQVNLNGVGAIPTVEAIQLFSNVFFSFPTTNTVRTKSFPPELVKLSNELTKIEVEDFKSKGGTIMAIAPSASKDVFLRERVHMQPLKDGTMNMMKGWVIPVAITLDGNEPACEVLKWRYVNDHKDCHDTMRDIAKACFRQSLIPHHYYEKHSLFEEAKQGLSRLRKD